jgi:hypothetical protein
MKLFVLSALLFIWCHGYAQDDDLSNVISEVLFSKKVYRKVFYDFKPDRKFAFIFGNRLLQEKYPGILDKLQRSRFKVSYVEDRKGSIVIMGDAFYNSDIDLFIVFDVLEISSNENAEIEFHTTSLYEREKMRDRYVKVRCTLSKRKGKWRIGKLRMRPSKCCDKILGEIEIN